MAAILLRTLADHLWAKGNSTFRSHCSSLGFLLIAAQPKKNR
jgi:hypothetical protein